MAVSAAISESKPQVSMPKVQGAHSTAPADIFTPGRLVHIGKTKAGEEVEIRILSKSDQDMHPEFGKRITEMLHDDIVLVARIDGVFVGSCLAVHYGGAYINNLDVLPEHRNKGIGGAMLDAMIILAIEFGAKYIELSSEHPEPVHLYLRKGFIPAGYSNAMGEVYRLRIRPQEA